MTSSNRPAGKRLPISCQACRTRKIRCSRDGRPCQTCVRRGLGAEDCIYLGQPRLSSEPTPTADITIQNELLARIRHLEDLLHRQAGTYTDLLSPQASPTATGSFSESDSAIGLGPTECHSPRLGNVGTLRAYSSGYVRYLPFSSQWSSLTSSPGDTLQDIETDAPEDDDDLQIPLTKNSISREELLTMLPPGRYCNALKDVYFRVFSPMFHILHDLTFEAEYQQFCHDPSSVSTAWIALLFAILGIAITALDDDDLLLSDLGHEKTVSRNIKALSSRYRSAAMRCLAADGVMFRHSINSLQSLVLINYARAHRGLPTWTLLGFTHHVAISMGCHIDPDRFPLGTIEREERRRAWAGLTILYTAQHIGNSIEQRLPTGVKPPQDVNDIDILNGAVTTTTSSPIPGKKKPTQMTYLLLKLRLSKISTMINEALFSFAPRYSIPQIETEILAIHETCDKQYQLDSPLDALPPHHLANLNILYSYMHQLLLLLLRPSLLRYLQAESELDHLSTNTTRTDNDDSSARAKCLASAKASLSIYVALHESASFKAYKWYNSGVGSFHAFHAAVVLCAILMARPESTVEAVEIKDLLWRAMGVFAALSNRSGFCCRGVTVLRGMIDLACTKTQQSLLATSTGTGTGTSTPVNLTTTATSTHQSTPVPVSFPFSVSTPHMPLVSPSPASGAQYVQTGSRFPSSPADLIPEPLLLQLQPQNWVTPGAVPWEGWEFLHAGWG